MQSLKNKPLRKCNICGIEAHSETELSIFTLNNECKYGRTNICHRCYREKFGKKWDAINNPKHFIFGKDWVCPSENPRTNICSNCLRRYPNELKQQTHIHHESYNSSNPLDNTVELCHECHSKLHSFYRWNGNRGIKGFHKKEEKRG